MSTATVSVWPFSNACIKAVGNKGQWKDALKLLDEMDAHAKAGRYESRTILQVGFKG